MITTLQKGCDLSPYSNQVCKAFSSLFTNQPSSSKL